MAGTASAAVAAALMLLLLLLAAAAASSAAEPAATCTATRVLCQRQPTGLINCSSAATASSLTASFERRQPQLQPEFVTLRLPAVAAGSSSVDFSLASLQAVVSCFSLRYQAKLRLVVGKSECRLMPGSLDSLRGLQRLSLWLRFSGSRIPAGVFTAQLASLVNLQLESPGVSDVEPGAFEQLHRLTRLYISNLKLSHLTGAVLKGLSELRYLELPDNSLATLDAASFAGAPRLQSIDLRTTSDPIAVSLAPDTFCGLKSLQQLQHSASLRVNCSHFSSREIRLALSDGDDSRSVDCVRLLGERTPCSGAAGVAVGTVAMTTTTTTTTTTPTSTTASSTTSTTTTPARKRASTSSTAASSAAATKSTPTSTDPNVSGGGGGRQGQGKKQATAAAAGAGGMGPGAAAVLAVFVALAVLGASAAIFVAHRRRRGVLRRAHSRQPIFSGGGSGGGSSIDMQDSLWNPVFSGAGGASTSTDAPGAAGEASDEE